MILPQITLSPPKRLALAYTRPDLRSGLALILAFDDRLSVILNSSNEPLIAQMRLAWWNDVISKPLERRPIGEPLLAILAYLERKFADANVGAAMLKLTEAWDMLLAHEDWTPLVLNEYADLRSSAIFDWYGEQIAVFNCPQLKHLGLDWALIDLLQSSRTKAEYDTIKALISVGTKNSAISRELRPLSILARSQYASLTPSRWTGLRLAWHGLTGL